MIDPEGYRPRVERALRYIADNLANDLTVSEVAKLAHLSEFHFHRIFSAVVGEPIGRYVTRRRLEVAALRLAYEPARSVTEIALASGYSSPSNFSKAFTAYFGVSPSRVRHPDPGLPAAIGKLTRSYGREFHPADLHVLPPDDPGRARELAGLLESLRFATIAGFDVACLASPAGYDIAALERTWAELIARARELGLAEGPVDAWGIAHDSPKLTAPELCRYHACVPCPPGFVPPAPLFRGHVPAGRYAVFRHVGELAGVERAFRAIYSLWLPSSSVEVDDFTPIDHYVNDAPVEGKVDFEIWIKVRARRS
ncbi:AraC family transcriptional regulator [Nannocystaceae bacterium ST9]